MKKIMLAFVLTLACFLGLHAADNPTPPPAKSPIAANDSLHDHHTTEADKQLNAKIRSQMKGWLTDAYDNISLSTANGFVTVYGWVNNFDDQHALSSRIEKIPGVRSVNNRTQIMH